MDKIAVASDHGGFELKEYIKTFLSKDGYEIIDLGTDNEESVDYPDYAAKMANGVSNGTYARGILVCGTGIGMSIAVNKFHGVRGALCNDTFSARLSREHNDSNILILGGRVLGKGLAMDMVNVWISTKFEGGRHKARLDKIIELEKKC